MNNTKSSTNNPSVPKDGKGNGHTTTSRPGTATGGPRVIHPMVLDVLAVPPPASTSGLLTSTTTLASTAGMTSSNADNSDTLGINMHSEPFRSVMDNYGGW